MAEMSQAIKSSNDVSDLKNRKTNSSSAIKPAIKKRKIRKRRQASNKQSVKTKNRINCVNKQAIKEEEEENADPMDIPKVVSYRI